MPLTKLQFRPGVNRDTTSYANEGGWFDSDKIRFRLGFPEKIGGWVRKSVYSFLGVCRSIHTWVNLEGTVLTGVGTRVKFYIDQGGFLWDITPIRSTTTAGEVTFAATDGSSLITITDVSHNAATGDFVTFSAAVTLGGVITADVLNQEYQLTVIDGNSYTIVARAAATSIASITIDGALVFTPLAANASDTGNGGASVVGAYQLNVGLGTVVAGTGWGAGEWGEDGWGEASAFTTTNTLRIWGQDNYGEDLLFNVRDAGIYYWDTNTYTLGSNRAIALSSVAGADAATPTIAKQVLVSDRDRHVIVFGCDPVDAIGTQDPLLIRFSSQESFTEWLPAPTNTAGDLRVGSGSEIICAVETRQQTLVFTDTSVHSLQYLGPPFTFGIDQISENTTIIGPMAAVAIDDNVFWMGEGDFYVYTGQVQKLPCTVRSYVFNDINTSAFEVCTAAANTSFSEVWWFYPSANSEDCDRYVMYNYIEQSWAYGELARTAWQDKGINTNPIAAGTDNYLYLHESGVNDGSTNPPSPITSYVLSSQLSLGQGQEFVFLSKIIPDLTFDASTVDNPSADFILEVRNFPGGAYLQSDTSNVVQTSTTPVEQFTDQAFVRLRGRSFALKVQSNTVGTQWRLGMPRVEVRPDGAR
jgi:hypothetical protein